MVARSALNRKTLRSHSLSLTLKKINSTPFHTLFRDDARQVFVHVRTRARYPDAATFREDFETLWQPFDEVRDYGLIIDTREAIGRNDDDFEEVTKQLHLKMMSKIRNTAVLLQSQMGILQSQRIIGKDDAGNVLITRDEEEAFSFAAGHALPTNFGLH